MSRNSAVSQIAVALILASLIVGGTAGYLGLQPLGNEPIGAGESWLTGWSYRKSHAITAATGAGTNYQIKITVYYISGSSSGGNVYLAGKCRTTFGDIRFTDDDGSTQLDYWMESKVDNGNAVFWIEVADSLESAQTIYVYYGKSDATTTSNFDNTFIFGDPFDNASLNTTRWTSVDGGPIYTIDALNHYLEVTSMATSPWWTGVGFHSRTGIAFPATYIVEDAYSFAGMKINHKSDAIGEIFGAGLDIQDADSIVTAGQIGDSWAGDSHYWKNAFVGANTWSGGEQIGYIGTWYSLLTRIWKLGGNIKVEIDGTLRLNFANAESSDRVLLEIATYSTFGFGTERLYAFKIRKYVSPEPIQGVWGSEEIPINHSPNAPTLNSPAVGYHFNPSTSVTFSWTFSDPDAGDTQSAYQFQLDDNSDFSSPITNTSKVSSLVQQTMQTLPSAVGLYYWRVKTWDNYNAEGPYCGGRTIIVDKIKTTVCGILNSVVDTRTGGSVYYQAVYEYDSAQFTGSNGTLYLNNAAMNWTTDRWTYAFPYQMSGSQKVFQVTSFTETTYNLNTLNNAAGDLVLNWATMTVTINKP